MLPRPTRCLLALLALLPLPSTLAQSSQSLVAALQQQNLTLFSSLVAAHPSLFGTNQTVLAPTDEAFAAAAQVQGGTTFDVPSLLAYHLLDGTQTLQSMAVAAQGTGEVLPTQLKNASEVNMGGMANVVGVKSATMSGIQSTAPDGGSVTGQSISIQGGLGMESNISKGDVLFAGGIIQIINKVLSIPDTCSKTLNLQNVTQFIDYLAMAFDLVPSSGTSQPDPVGFYDNLTSITCFAPDNTAFSQQAPIYNAMNTQQISAAMGWHIFRGVFYTSELPSGSVLVPMWGNGTRGFVFTSNSSGMFLGDSQLVQNDWMIKNGVVHILDRPLNMNVSVPVDGSTSVASGYGLPSNSSSPTTGGTSPTQTPINSGALGRTTYVAGSAAALAAIAAGVLALL